MCQLSIGSIHVDVQPIRFLALDYTLHPPMSTSIRIISLGTLASHPLWTETSDPRTPHATTSLITSGDQQILVNPSLPPPMLDAHLKERSGIGLPGVTDVFLTSFYPDHRRGLVGLEHASWLMAEAEHEAMESFLVDERTEAESHKDTERLVLIDDEHQLLERVKIAPDSIGDGVDLFPLHGVSPGCCGLLLPQPRATILVCGDAVATIEHYERGMVLEDCWDRNRAIESFKEAVEIADLLVPGRDNLIHT